MDCFSSGNEMEWNGMDSRITSLPSLTLALPCNLDSTKRVSACYFVLHHFCCYFMAFCSATVRIKSLILTNEGVHRWNTSKHRPLRFFITILLGFCLPPYYCVYYANLRSRITATTSIFLLFDNE